MSSDPPATRLERSIPIVGALLLAAFALLVRMQPPAYAVDAGGVGFHDNDTVRRLARMELLAESEAPYPSPDPRDGAPAGTVLHWTRPMDWAIGALSVVAPSIAETASPLENGAAWAGPLIAALTELLFTLLVTRLLGWRLGLAAAAVHALSTTWIGGTRLGIGDHQVLQHAALVTGVLGMLVVLVDRGGRGMAWLAGCALGFSLWVSTESMAAFVALGAALGVAVVAATESQRWRLVRAGRSFSLGALLLAIVGHVVENPHELLAFAWDRPSLFQALLVVPLVVFFALLVWREQVSRGLTLVCALASVLAVVVPFLLPPLADVFRAEVASLAAANAWAQASVAEYLPLLRAPYSGELTSRNAVRVLTAWIWIAPLSAVGLLLVRAWPFSARLATVSLALGLFALALLELKLAHLFVVVYPIVVVAGSDGVVAALRGDSRPRRETCVALACLLVFGLYLSEAFERDPAGEDARAARRELVLALRELPGGCVIASWELGAHVMRDAEKPVVASGYHRNLAGIRDATRFLCATDDDDARAIARERGARWFVYSGNPVFLLNAGLAFPELGTLATWEGQGPRFSDAARASLWWRVTEAPESIPWLREVYQSPRRATWFGRFVGPRFRVFEIRD